MQNSILGRIIFTLAICTTLLGAGRVFGQSLEQLWCAIFFIRP
jgi:hypothetical protein